MFVRLNEEQATASLARQRVGRLGCIVDAGPYIVPVNYFFENGSVYSPLATRYEDLWLLRDPRGC
jgi:nitroimidazol reductase NimA-like FMN-containing flavoprotein (pyridoxamine 5'-phosphate oxidase superfamily)